MHGKAALYASTYILCLHSEVPPAPALQFNCNWLFPTVYWHFLLPSTYKLNCPKWPRPTGSTGQYFTHELGLNEKLHIKRSTLILLECVQKLSNVNRHTGCPAREFHLVRCMQCMLCQKVGFAKNKFSAIFHLLHFCHNKISTILIFQLLWRAALYKGCCSNVLFFTRNTMLD